MKVAIALHHQLWQQHDQIDGGKQAGITVWPDPFLNRRLRILGGGFQLLSGILHGFYGFFDFLFVSTLDNVIEKS